MMKLQNTKIISVGKKVTHTLQFRETHNIKMGLAVDKEIIRYSLRTVINAQSEYHTSWHSNFGQ